MKRILNVMSWRKPQVMKFTAVVFTLALVILTLPTTIWAGDAFRFKGQAADAFFSSFDPSGCIQTFVFIFAVDEASISHDPPGKPNSFSGSGAFFTISKFDFCTNTQLMGVVCSNSAPLADADFQVIGKKLGSAELNATLECFDFVSGSSFDGFVDVDWTPIGDPVTERRHFHLVSPGLIVNERINSTSRPAELSGSVSDGITNLIADFELIGNISSVKDGSVTVD